MKFGLSLCKTISTGFQCSSRNSSRPGGVLAALRSPPRTHSFGHEIQITFARALHTASLRLAHNNVCMQTRAQSIHVPSRAHSNAHARMHTNLCKNHIHMHVDENALTPGQREGRIPAAFFRVAPDFAWTISIYKLNGIDELTIPHLRAKI